MISAKIIADSINPAGNRITSWILTYPRFIHAEMMTHRCFSRNASSSRAVPIEKTISEVANTPASPEFWGANQKGMQAELQLDPETITEAQCIWWDLRDQAIRYAENLKNLGLHKQLVNRILEPFLNITVLATATEHTNFFSLRAHPSAQPEIQVLAYRMLDRFVHNTPIQRDWGEWHIPFRDQMPDGLNDQQKLKIATARAARLSYRTFEGQIDPQKDFDLHDRLMASGHWSPFEHCACAIRKLEHGEQSNFRGWKQYRKFFSEENRYVDLEKLLKEKPGWISLN